ncbi:hypothetical protein [Acidithiobacillus sp.]|uniref:hypothetical protein n=1 Tax=Acidithiobacillus sp. TaxID=1872118 RepID=UPI0025B846F2|nr:hypothetical protein [Acidithiobacillus sp.]
MHFSHLHNGIYNAKEMAAHPERYTKAEMRSEADELGVVLHGLLDFIGVLGQVMHYTGDNGDAWQGRNLRTVGEALASLADLATGIDDIRFDLLNPSVAKSDD